MRTRIFSAPTNGTPTAAWQDGDATTGQSGSLLPFTTPSGVPAGSGGTLQGPGSFISAQFSLATAPTSLLVALATNGAATSVTVNLESYSNFAWVVLDTSSLASTANAANLPTGQLSLLRLRVTVSANAAVQCVPILSNVSAPTGGGGSGGSTGTTTTNECIGQVPIPNGADHVDVVFDSAFTTQPAAPWVSVQRANPTDPLISCVDVTGVTLTGFTASLSAAVANGNYQLSYRTLVEPAPSTPALTATFDTAVFRYAWGPANGRDLDTRTAITDPSRNVVVGWARAAQDAQGASVYLQWGGDNTSPTGDEAVLVDFAALTRDYPQATEFKVDLGAFWYGPGFDAANGTDGKFTIEFATYLGGTTAQSGTDFVNTGGTARQDLVLARQSYTDSVGADVDGDPMATLVYTVATKQAVIVPASAPPMPSSAQSQASSLLVRSSATK